MASTITAGTTTGTALAMSGDTSGNMSLVCGSTVVAALTATGVAITGTLSVTSMASSVITSGTAQATTSGTFKDFTGIPSWVKRITVMFNGVSTNGTSAVQVQIGSGSVTTSGYAGAGVYAGATNSTLGANSGTGLLIEPDTGSTVVRYGWAILTTLGSNIWVMGSQVNRSDSAYGQIGGGGITLGGTLDRVRVTTVGGVNTFDAGSINILYE